MAARLPVSSFDPHGKSLTIAGAGEVISIQIDDGHAWQQFEADPDRAVVLAHELLERAVAGGVGCDETDAALVALRALAAREDALSAVDERVEVPR